ncbi:MAG: response regulator [Lachnospiraceae bacterium]|nr:response regulator [Lachnospiraceae bacterium]
MGFYLVFTILMIVCIGTVIFSLTEKHKNIGYIFTSILVVILNIFCLYILAADTLEEARRALILYYLIYPWLFFGTLWTVEVSDSLKKHYDCYIVMGLICIFQTGLVAVSAFKDSWIKYDYFSVFGREWWVACMPGGEYHSFVLPVFLGLCVVNALIIFTVMMYYLHHVPKEFKFKYIIFGVFQGIMLAMILLTFILEWPVWIHTIIMNFICFLDYYYLFIYSDFKLRDTVLYDFANDMTDGLIIYNKFGELVHLNDRLKVVLTEESLEGIKNLHVFEERLAASPLDPKYNVLIYKNGDTDYYFRINRSVIGPEHHEIGTVYIMHDSTASVKQMKYMEEMNDELERAAKMKSDFLANMSHELRTPMNAVIGLAEIAQREKDVSPSVRNLLDQISSSGKNLLTIINDILDFSKIEAGKMEIIPEKYEPLSEVNDISYIMESRIGEKNINFIFLVDTTLPHELIGDNMRIRQVLINLTNNAIKFTDHGIVKIELTCHHISDDEVKLEFHIVDTGRGIKEEDLKKLFVSFQQVDNKRNRNVEGTGLGLAISKRLVEAMGGEIGVNSKYGKGSDFWFTVPQKVSNKKRDLVVDDAENKYVFCLNENALMQDEFTNEMNRFGLEGKLITSLEKYSPTGKHDYLFFESTYYKNEMQSFLDEHPDVMGIMLCEFDSTYRSDRKNLRILKKPLSTLAMVLAFNGKTIDQMKFKTREAKYVHFTAPDAKILIVDDNSINLSIAVGLLEPLEVKCSIAQSGMEAIEKLKEERFDLILMDHMMPEMDGVETSREIRQTLPEADDTPIIALTANVMEGSKELFLKAGMVDMIAKPIDVNQLNAKLIKWLPNYLINEEKETEPVKEESYDQIYDCLDCVKAIKGLGTEALFKKVVEDYFKAGKENMSSIENAYVASDWHNYAIKTHSLKSTSRQIGAYDLGDIAEKLELAGKAEDENEIRKYHETAMTMYQKLLVRLSKYFDGSSEENPSASDDKSEISDDRIKEIFDKLREACDNLDMDGMEECGKELEGYSHPGNKQTIVKKMLDAISGIDTDKITELMDEYMK